MTMKSIIAFMKKEIVLTISGILAVISMFLVHPGPEYLEYIDFRTLSILLCLMLVVAGARGLGVFRAAGQALLARTGSFRGLTCVLILMSFFFSMVITNDVALLTFVPFAIEVLTMAKQRKYMIPVVVLQTIAANLGSMLTPIGNPQNLYLFSLSGMSLGSFLGLLAPYTIVSLVMLLAANQILIRRENVSVAFTAEQKGRVTKSPLLGLYGALFVICLLTVARILPYYIVLLVVVVLVAVADRKTLGEADYGLLCTFTFLFIFIGNLGRIPAISDLLLRLIQGRELITAVAASQVMSNVPAAILLSGFTNRFPELILGVNLGGLGTLIASMASLISYKFYAREEDSRMGSYLGVFTISNLIFLAVLYLMYVIL